MNKYLRHLIVVLKHKFYVMLACLRAGYFVQGIMHDNSKLGITEFCASARNFQGTYSPIEAEKQKYGYSLAWQHHKGTNKHHWQYWIDWEQGKQIVLEMPLPYVAEMICDWVGAGKAYNKDAWTIDTFKKWYKDNKHGIIVHENTRDFIEGLMESVKTESDIYFFINPDLIEMFYIDFQLIQRLKDLKERIT